MVSDPERQAGELNEFRTGLYACLGTWRDALFELADALLTSSGPVTSLPMLSLEPVFRRGHGSLYAALAGGRIDQTALSALLSSVAPADWPPVFAVDTSAWPRPSAEASPEREFCHVPQRGGAAHIPGWTFSLVARVNPAASGSSWTAPVNVRRLDPRTPRHAQTVAQVRDVAASLPAGSPPLFVLDAGYSGHALTRDLAGTPVQVLVRIRSDARLLREAPTRPPGAIGRPRVHGARIAPDARPDEVLTEEDARGVVTVRAWHRVHAVPRHGEAIVAGSMLEVSIARPPRDDGVAPSRVLPPLRLFWTGPGEPDLALLWRAYLHRFDIEHTFRCWKGTLGWTVPALRTPAQAERWTCLVAAVYTQLRLALGLVAEIRLPWHRVRDPARLTPGRVRRGFAHLLATLVPQARCPKPSKPGSGWPRGRPRPRPPRLEVVRRGD